MFRNLLAVAVVAGMFVVCDHVQAAPVTFIGADAGAVGGGAHPNSDAAASAFDIAAGALGPVSTIDFESAPVGGFASLLIAPGVTVTGSGTSINNVDGSSVFGSNTTAGGRNFLNYPGSFSLVTFSFATAIQSFGAYFTGLQGNAVGQQTINYVGGGSQTVNIPLLSSGLAFVGFTDAGQMISSVSVQMFNDITGIDDVRYGNATVPEPTSMALFGLTALGLGALRRRKRTAGEPVEETQLV